jgi:hypothetical protein
MCTVAAAPGAPSVWQLTSWRRGPRGGRPPPEGASVAYALREINSTHYFIEGHTIITATEVLGFGKASRKLTLMACLLAGSFLLVATPASALTLTIKPIHICNNAGTGCGNASEKLFEAEGDKIWAQAGIDLTFLSWGKINNTSFLDVTIGSGAVIATEAQNVMTAGTAINNTATTLAINMFFAPTLDSDPGLFGLGCGGAVFAAFCNNQVGVFIADNVFSFNGGIGRLDTLAHELGHVLNLEHTAVANQLMASGGVRSIPNSINNIFPDGSDLDQLTAAEIATAIASPYLTATKVPEPGTLVLVGLGMFGFAFAGRMRKARVR